MKLFTAVFDLVTLPVKLATDVVCIIPDLMNSDAPLDRTREQCKKIDEDLFK